MKLDNGGCLQPSAIMFKSHAYLPNGSFVSGDVS